MVRAVHQTVEECAVREPEHVIRLVREHFAAPAKQKSCVIGVTRFAVKRRIVAGKAVNADALAQGCLAEYEIPRWLWIKIFHGDSQHAERVGRHAWLEKIEDVAGKDL